jgi:hypothetical protein
MDFRKHGATIKKWDVILNKTFSGPSHTALYFWGFLHSCFVLLYAVGKLIDLRFVFGVNLSCRHFSKCCDFV